MGCSPFANYCFQMGVTVMVFAEHFGPSVLCKCCQVFLTSQLEEGEFEVYFCRAFLNLNKEPPKIGHFCHFSNHHTAS